VPFSARETSSSETGANGCGGIGGGLSGCDMGTGDGVVVKKCWRVVAISCESSERPSGPIRL
jgi:hypothetical protein